jgi:hypothetical protein
LGGIGGAAFTLSGSAGDTNDHVTIDAIMVANGTGTFTVQFAQATATGTSTAQTGTVLVITQQ